MSDTDVAALRDAVSQLSLTQRRVLVLHYAEELTIPEIALVLDLPEARVQSTIVELQNLARRRVFGADDASEDIAAEAVAAAD